MKKLILSAVAAGSMLVATAQDTVKVKRINKHYDALLPAWCLDINLKGGLVMQDLSQVNMSGNYTNAIGAKTDIGTVNFNNGMSYGFDAQLGYFFGKKRHWGLGVGVMYLKQSGDMKLDKFHVEYQSTDFGGDVFRQLLTANGPITESLKMTNMSIPAVLKYKNQLGKHWGFAIDAGLLYNLQLKNSYTTDASFDYEAIYAYQNTSDGLKAYYDNSPTPGSNAWVITKSYYTGKNPNGNIADSFSAFRVQGYNVGLGLKPNSKTGDASYKSGSIGLLLKPSVSYLISPNVALDLGIVYTYQTFKSAENNYRLTDKVGGYSSLTNGMSAVNSGTLGINIGARIYFGKDKDSDGDGIPDKRDECPLVKGLEQFHGCPDTDGDGIQDKEDECPTVKGLAAFHGCPDTDGDGIIDKDDECPAIKGLVQLHGCPDTDGDGIADKDDACPTVKGLAQYHGCPDTDGDGVPDNEDKCPTEAGPASNNGCPVRPASIVDQAPIQKDIATPVLFDVNKIVIRKSSLPTLDDVVKNLNENKIATIIIDGYTDNIGNITYNKALSAKRAAVVKLYLLKHGVKDMQIKTHANGSASPAAPNSTKEGRALNRRAVIRIQIDQ